MAISVSDKKIDEMSWVQKFRPDDILDVILPTRHKSVFENMIAFEKVQNLLLAGLQGTGKTTSALAFIKTLGWEYLVINASEDRGIDVARTTLPDFCGRGSRNGKPRFVLLEEADNMTPALQSALRRLIEKYSKRVVFILTANSPNKIIAPIRESRFVELNFNYTAEDIKEIRKPFAKRIIQICKHEDVIIEDKKALIHFIGVELSRKPDMRRLMQTIQFIAVENGFTDVDGTKKLKIPASIKAMSNLSDFDNLKKVINTQDHAEYYKYVSSNTSDEIFMLVEDNISKFKSDKIFEVLGQITAYDTNNFMCERTATNMVNFLRTLYELMD